MAANTLLVAADADWFRCCAVCNIQKGRYSYLQLAKRKSTYSIKLRSRGVYYFWDSHGGWRSAVGIHVSWRFMLVCVLIQIHKHAQMSMKMLLPAGRKPGQPTPSRTPYPYDQFWPRCQFGVYIAVRVV